MYVDRRTLHVANIYSKYENLSPTQVLQEVHNSLKLKFKKIALNESKAGMGSKNEAKELQDFFQSLKLLANGVDKNSLSSAVDADAIQQVLETTLGNRSGGWRHLFGSVSKKASRQGELFEIELQNVMAAVFEEVAQKTQSQAAKKRSIKAMTSSLGLGKAQVGINSILNIDEIASSIVAQAGQEVYESVMTDMQKAKFASVQGKIDVSGTMATVEISATANPYLKRIAFLLSKASFSAKSYRTMTYDRRNDIVKEITKLSKLHLGTTNQTRIYTDILAAEAKLPEPVALSFALYLQKTHKASLGAELSRLRFIYELTGYGQRYIDDAIENVLRKEGASHANYFIYNDPSTNDIYVESTAAIITELWEEIANLLNSKEIALSRQYFYGKA